MVGSARLCEPPLAHGGDVLVARASAAGRCSVEALHCTAACPRRAAEEEEKWTTGRWICWVRQKLRLIIGVRYSFYQVHWHSPSEYTVDAISFPLDAHFVHQLDDVALHGTYHRLAVIGLLYELGECNRSLDNFWSEFPEMKTGISFPLEAYLVHQLDDVALHCTYHRFADWSALRT